MRRTVLAAALLVVLMTPAWADFWDGVKAYHGGDYAAALKEWRPLAEQGHGDAQNNLGILYDAGQGVGQDHATAVRWFRRAAEQGFTDAQNNLGVMYRHGLGVAEDKVRAHRWFNIAAALGNQAARENADLIARTMSAGELVEARDAAKAWLMEHQGE